MSFELGWFNRLRKEASPSPEQWEVLKHYSRIQVTALALAEANAAAEAFFKKHAGGQSLSDLMVFLEPATIRNVLTWSSQIDRWLIESNFRSPFRLATPLSGKAKVRSTNQFNIADNADLLTVDQARQFFGGISRAALYAGIKKGHYPKPIKLGSRTSRWIGRSVSKHSHVSWRGNTG